MSPDTHHRQRARGRRGTAEIQVILTGLVIGIAGAAVDQPGLSLQWRDLGIIAGAAGAAGTVYLAWRRLRRDLSDKAVETAERVMSRMGLQLDDAEADVDRLKAEAATATLALAKANRRIDILVNELASEARHRGRLEEQLTHANEDRTNLRVENVTMRRELAAVAAAARAGRIPTRVDDPPLDAAAEASE